MPKFIQVWELYQVSGDELGRYEGTLGWYTTPEGAKAATREAYDKRGCFADANRPPRNAIVLDTGEIYVLYESDAVKLDKVRLRPKREL